MQETDDFKEDVFIIPRPILPSINLSPPVLLNGLFVSLIIV